MQGPYRVELSPAAERQVRRLRLEDARVVRETLLGFSHNPRPQGSIKLSGFSGIWRIRARSLRIIYEIFDDERLVMVLRVTRRDERTYRRL